MQNEMDILKFLYYSGHWPVKNIIGWFTSEIVINEKMIKNLLSKSYDFQNGKNYIGIHFSFSFTVAGKSELESNAFSDFKWKYTHAHGFWERSMNGNRPILNPTYFPLPILAFAADLISSMRLERGRGVILTPPYVIIIVKSNVT